MYVASQVNDDEVQKYCVITLVELMKYDRMFNSVIQRLSLFMRSGNAEIRQLTAYKIKAFINAEKSNNKKYERNIYVKSIFQSAQNDENYLVRQALIESN